MQVIQLGRISSRRYGRTTILISHHIACPNPDKCLGKCFGKFVEAGSVRATVVSQGGPPIK